MVDLDTVFVFVWH